MPGQPGTQDLEGERNHFSPEWQGSLVADWRDAPAMLGGLEWYVRGEVQYVGDQNIGTNTNNNPQTEQDAYALWNARLGLAGGDDWDVSLFGRNLTDEGYCVSIFQQPFGSSLGAIDAAQGTSVMRCVNGAPRTWGVALTLRR